MGMVQDKCLHTVGIFTSDGECLLCAYFCAKFLIWRWLCPVYPQEALTVYLMTE